LVSKITDYVYGYTDEIPSLGPEVESQKFELIHWLNIWEWGDAYHKSSETDQYMMKQRLFYISGSLNFTLDKLMMHPFSNRARYFMSAIGIEVTNGGLLELWDILEGNEYSPLYHPWERVIRKWQARGIDLSEVVFGEGDWSSYDQTLCAVVLAVVFGMVLCMFETVILSDPVIKMLFTLFLFNNVIKVMYVYLFAAFF